MIWDGYMIELWRTQIGSHLWKMNHEGSDNDFFAVHIAPSEDILNGSITKSSSKVMKIKGDDYVSHEVGKVVDELIKGNINFLTGIMSDIIVYNRSCYLYELRDLVKEYGQTKACVNSIKGIAIGNYTRYVLGNENDPTISKRCGIINRSLLFGINLLSGEGFKFNPVINPTPKNTCYLFKGFDYAVKNSSLLEKTNPEPFRDWLYNLRLDELNGRI